MSFAPDALQRIEPGLRDPASITIGLCMPGTGVFVFRTPRVQDVAAALRGTRFERQKNDTWPLADKAMFEATVSSTMRECACCHRPGAMKKCAGCGVAHYCSRECHVADWQRHQGACASLAEQQQRQ